MSSVFDQSDQKMKLSGGPLTPDKVFIIGFSGQETLSRLFSFEVQFLSTELQLDAQKLIGQNLTVEVDRFDKDVNVIGTRYFNGYVSRLWAGSVTEEKEKKYRTYRARLVPWLWFLTQTSRCHIFFPEKEEKSIFEIIEDVMNRAAGGNREKRAKHVVRSVSHPVACQLKPQNRADSYPLLLVLNLAK